MAPQAVMLFLSMVSIHVLFPHRSGLFPPHTICQLCSKSYTDPRILPCLHSFCGQCLHMEIERSGDKQKMECPTCQRSITIPEGGVNAIPQNLHLGFEVEVAGYMSKIGSGHEKSCDACTDGDKGSAVVFCCTCRQFLCTFCHEHHRRNKILRHHQMVGLDQEFVRLLPSIMTPTEHLCSQPHHEKEDHRIAEVCNIAKVHRDGMREALVCAQEMASKLTSAIGDNDKMAEQVETSRENATLLINQTFEQLHLAIEERKKTLLSEMGTISLSKTTALSLQKEQLVKIQDEIDRYTEMTSHILQTHTDHEVVALGDLLPTELKATLKKVGGVSLTPSQSSDIHVTLQTDSLMKELSLFGHVMATPPSQSTWSSKSAARMDMVYSVKVETKSSEGERYPYGGLQVKAELRPKSHDGAVVPGKVEDHGDGTYTITLTPEAAGPHQLLITMDGEHVQGSPHDLDVRPSYSTLWNPQQVISCSGGPLGIAIHDSGDIYVASDDNSIHVYDQGGHEKRTIGSGGSGDGQFSSPRGISIKGDVMYVADSCNHRIQKLTTGGQFLQKFGQRGSGQGQFNYPRSIIVDLQRDRMIVADEDNHRVVILDQNGSWLMTINGNVSGAQGFKYPWGLALDPQGKIHVAAYGSNTVKVFTPEGTYVRSYGDVKGPFGITIDEEGYSLVSECSGNCLSIFDPQGNKIHTVGSLTNPRGVALDTISGSLYVANANTSRCSGDVIKM